MPVSALVFLHSPFVAPVTWRGVADQLAADGFTVVVPDVRGALGVQAIAATIAAEIPAGVTSTVLIGHSGAGPLLPAIAEAPGTTVVQLTTSVVLAHRDR